MSTTIILDGKRVDGSIFGYNPEPDHSTDAVPEPYKPSSSSKNTVVPEASRKSKEPEDVIIMPKRHRLFDTAFEESLGHFGRFICPYEECHFNNYVFGFRTRGARNRHIVECSYGKGKLQKNAVATDGQMPSARFIENLVDKFNKRVDLNRALQQLFKKPYSVQNVSSLNIVSAPPPAAQESLNKNSQTAEQSRPQLSNATLENNNMILSSYGGSGQLGGQEMMTERYATQSDTSRNNVTLSSFDGSGQLQENYPNKSEGLENNEMMISFAQPGLLPEQSLTMGGSIQNNVVWNPYRLPGNVSENNPIQSGVLGNNNVMVNPFEELGQFPTFGNNVILSSSGESRTFPGNFQPQICAFENDGTINSYENSGFLPEYQFPTASGLLENNAILSSYKESGNFPGNYPIESGAFANTGMMNYYSEPGLLPKYHFSAEMGMLENNAILSSYGTSGQFPQQYHTSSNTLGNNVNMNSYGELPQLPQQYVPQSGTLENNRITNSFGEPEQFTEYYATESGIFNSNGMVYSYDELREILDGPHPTQNALGVSNGGQIPQQYPTLGGAVANNEIGNTYGEFGQLIENQTSAVETITLGCFNENFYNAGDYNSHRPLEGTSTQEGFRFSEIDKMFDSDFHEYLRGTTAYENVSMEDVLISNPSRMLDDPFVWNG